MRIPERAKPLKGGAGSRKRGPAHRAAAVIRRRRGDAQSARSGGGSGGGDVVAKAAQIHHRSGPGARALPKGCSECARECACVVRSSRPFFSVLIAECFL